jgi:hypothetical protein
MSQTASRTLAENSQKYAIGVASVFDGMGRNPGNKAHIVGIEGQRVESPINYTFKMAAMNLHGKHREAKSLSSNTSRNSQPFGRSP